MLEPPIEVVGDKLVLYFSGTDSIQLERTVFSHRLIGGVKRTVRGKTAGAFTGYETFQWTSGLQALSALLVETVAWSACPRARVRHVMPRLVGDSASLASALDFSLSKQPLWLCDIFGWDKQGRAFARALFCRTNPERKRPGPVVVTLNSKLLSPSAIIIVLNGSIVTEGRILDRLSNAICREWADSQTRKRAKAPKVRNQTSGFHPKKQNFDETWLYQPPLSSTQATQFQDMELDLRLLECASSPVARFDSHSTVYPHLSHQLHKVIYGEVQAMLSRTDIFSQSALLNLTTEILCDESFQKISGPVESIVDSIDLNLPPKSLIGVIEDSSVFEKHLKSSEVIRCAVAPAPAAATAIFYSLRCVHGYNISTRTKFANSLEIASKILSGDLHQTADLCVLSGATAATVLSASHRTKFHPFMILPRVSHRLIAPKTARRDDTTGRYVFLNESPSTTRFYFEQLQRLGQISRNTPIEHSEPDETTQLLFEGDPELRAVMWFPCYKLNELYNNCVPHDNSYHHLGGKLTLLFAHESFLEDHARARSLDIAIRNAWLQLQENSALLWNLVGVMLRDEQYMKAFVRTAGLHNIPSICFPMSID